MAKKVLFLSNHAGFSKFNEPYMSFFKNEGWEVHNASPGIEVGDVDVHHDVSISRSPLSPSNLKAFVSLVKLCRFHNYDLIHCHTPVGGVLGRLLKLFSRSTKVVYTAHGFHFFKGGALHFWLLYFPVEFFLSFLTDHLVLINDEDFVLAKRYFPIRNISKINGVGVNLERFKSDVGQRAEVRELLGLNDRAFVFIYVAQFVPRKQHAFLVGAFNEFCKQNEDARLILVGEGALRPQVRNQIENLGLEEKVFDLGYRTDVEKLYLAGDVLLSVSSQEGFGINLVEGLACGLPILASLVRGHRDILSLLSSEHVGFSSEDESDLVEKMELIYSRRNKLTHLRDQFSKEAKAFDVQSSVLAMKPVYGSVVSL